MNKFETIRDSLRKIKAGSPGELKLLDVGCRDCVLKPHVSDLAAYEGVDLFQNDAGTVNHVVDVSRGLPMPDGSYDVVVALDLLEHLDDLQKGLDELLRVSRGHVLILLPNMAHVSYRLTFLRRGYLNDKYNLRFNQGLDRHRWLTTGVESRAFAEEYARARGVKVETQWFVDSKRKAAFAGFCKTFGMSPDWWAIASLHLFSK
ncbi:MAG TPA: methyltransferase domain-containing protein [Steroidobacteraceae bacterium]|nr:methyltransferase domain-containing protein [Steroidobacteraceae bacterium]